MSQSDRNIASKAYQCELLAIARETFWIRGHAHIATHGLEEPLASHKAYIEAEFGGLDSLFLKVLETFSAETIEEMQNIQRSGLDGIVDHLTRLSTDSPERKLYNYGCLMVNATVDNLITNRLDIKVLTDTHFQKVQDVLEDALNNAIKTGEMTSGMDPHALSAFLLGHMVGMHFHIRCTGNIAAARHRTKVAVSIVNDWRSTSASDSRPC